MNVLFINGRFPQYSQTFVHDQVKSLKEISSAKVEVFARSLDDFRFENSEIECSSEILYAKPENKRLFFRILRGVLRSPLFSAKLLKLRFEGKIWHQTLMLCLQMRRTPDVIVTHFGHNYRIGQQLKRFVFTSAKNVIVFHGHDMSSYIVSHSWAPYKEAAGDIDLALCVNKQWERLLKQNTTIQSVRTLYLGTHIPDVYPGVCLPEEMTTPTLNLLFVGRFVEKKGFITLYRAIRRLRDTSDLRIRVHCVGDGPQLEFFTERATADGIKDAFVFYGAKQKSFVRDLMKRCNLFILPSHTAPNGDSEGLPVVLMEAMAAGLPAISTYHSGIPELIEDNKTGFLIQEKDDEALAKILLSSSTNSKLLESISVAAFNHVKKHHNEVVQAKKFTEIVRGML